MLPMTAIQFLVSCMNDRLRLRRQAFSPHQGHHLCRAHLLHRYSDIARESKIYGVVEHSEGIQRVEVNPSVNNSEAPVRYNSL